jgi:hypothetical protein
MCEATNVADVTDVTGVVSFQRHVEGPDTKAPTPWSSPTMVFRYEVAHPLARPFARSLPVIGPWQPMRVWHFTCGAGVQMPLEMTQAHLIS